MAVGVAYWQMPGEWRLIPCKLWLGLLRNIIVVGVGVLTHVVLVSGSSNGSPVSK
jgi:hypothetical protein